jgi:hypothetical protein
MAICKDNLMQVLSYLQLRSSFLIVKALHHDILERIATSMQQSSHDDKDFSFILLHLLTMKCKFYMTLYTNVVAVAHEQIFLEIIVKHSFCLA